MIDKVVIKEYTITTLKQQGNNTKSLQRGYYYAKLVQQQSNFKTQRFCNASPRSRGVRQW
jgi:hypothetical protein